VGGIGQQQIDEFKPRETNQASATGGLVDAIRAYTLSEEGCQYAFIQGLFDGMAAPRSTSTVAEGKVCCYNFSFDADVATRSAQAASQPHTNAVDNDHAGDDSR
jgi:hypothetical protein